MKTNWQTKKYRELLDQIIVEVKTTPLEDQKEPFKSWIIKNNIIINDIENLKKDTNDRYKIFAFLLETQFIEFQLIDLLQELQIVVNSDPDVIKFSGKKRTKELYELSLGLLYEELCKYESDFLNDIKILIKKLNEKRIYFAHYLFTSSKGINEMIKQAKEGLVDNEKILTEFCIIFKHIEQKTFYGQMYESKRVNKI